MSASRRAVLTAVAALPLLVASSVVCADADGATDYVNGLWWERGRFVRGERRVRSGVFVSAPSPAPARRVDLRGAFVVPPYGDAHNHLTDARSNDAFIAAGVFYVKNPTLLATAGSSVRAFLTRPGAIDAKLGMGALTSPGGHPEKFYVEVMRKHVLREMTREQLVGNAFHPVTTVADVERALDALVRQQADFVKIVLLWSEKHEARRDDPAFYGVRGMDPALTPFVVAGARKRGLKVSAHIETAADFRSAVQGRVDEIAHMPGYAAGVQDDEPLGPYRITAGDARSAKTAGVRVVTTAGMARSTPPADRRAAVDALKLANLRHLRAAGVPIILGTDEAPGGLLEEARYLVDVGAFSAAEVLRLMSETTPQAIFPGRRIGELRPGFEASFLTLSADPRIDIVNAGRIEMRVKQGLPLEGPHRRAG